MPSLVSDHVKLSPHVPLEAVLSANAMLGKIEKTIITAKTAAQNLKHLFICAPSFFDEFAKGYGFIVNCCLC
jgi:hypothetical protein